MAHKTNYFVKKWRQPQYRVIFNLYTDVLYTRRVTHSPTLGENAYLVENTTSTLWCLRIFFGGKCPFRWILLIGMYQRVFLTGYSHVSVRFCVCLTTRRASDILLERANWSLQWLHSALCRRIIWSPRINSGGYLCLVSEFFDSYQMRYHFSEYLFTEMLPWPNMLNQGLPGFIRGNQVIRLQSAEGGRCNNQFACSSKRYEAQREVTQTQDRAEICLYPIRNAI